MSSAAAKRTPAVRIIALLLAGVLASLFLSGCWDEVEIEDRALVLGLAIDLADGKDQHPDEGVTHRAEEKLPTRRIHVTAQIAVPGRVPLGPGTGSGSKESPVWVVEVEGKTLDDAMNNLQQQVADPRYLIHLRVIVISQSIAKQGIQDLNDYLRRNPEIRRSTWLLVASDGRASKYMDVNPPLQRVPTLYILSMMEKAVATGKLPPAYCGEFWSSLSHQGQDGILPYISLRRNENILIKGLAYFRKGKMVGATTPLDIGIYMAVMGMDPGGYSVLQEVPGVGVVMVRVTSRFSRRTSEIVNGVPHIAYDIHLEGNVDEHYSEEVFINNTGTLNKIESCFEKYALESAALLMEETQKKRSDIWGTGEFIRAHHPGYWGTKIDGRDKWNEEFPKVKVSFRIQITMKRVGLKER
ncbi:Ger(x)C family spore germination protein [Paenibacillus spiritus]|uniref:Ger(X)C family spore germination protein n=1 Tax=Paenibacillus spiritus TaxID=2496557 RepID=A0A5J5GJQ1_9BACL|nr:MULTISPECIES: Ger(x)C family spore germination protein [Paenibacillus]KAA9008491.1 Ger(x)C family spore germination protein [Paenibacillus spiritus]